jgi:phosphoserine aminotransferase
MAGETSAQSNIMAPAIRPQRPFFSSGPCAKRPGWTPASLEDAFTGRSHRSAAGQARLRVVIELSRRLLRLPESYRMAIVPGSDTGAMEMALWSLLGARGVDALAWDSFGELWVEDITQQLRIENARVLRADYGSLPDLAQVNFERDVVFTWNGTTSGVRVPNGEWIPDERAGLTICDATSAVLAMEIPWTKLDVATWSWQKSLGGEAAHGMLILSPRAVARLEHYVPPWPLPKLFRLTRNRMLMEELFDGFVINTPSMLCVEDMLDALLWADAIGGLTEMIARAQASFRHICDWVEATSWVEFLASEAAIRSPSSVCLSINDPWFTRLSLSQRWTVIRELTTQLEQEKVAYDVAAYRSAPPGLRIWCGPTVDPEDVQALLPWLDWAYNSVRERG